MKEFSARVIKTGERVTLYFSTLTEARRCNPHLNDWHEIGIARRTKNE